MYANVSHGLKAHLEGLLPVLPELVLGGVSDDLVVHGLPHKVLVVGVHGHGRQGVQAGVGDVLYLHWDAELPHPAATMPFTRRNLLYLLFARDVAQQTIWMRKGKSLSTENTGGARGGVYMVERLRQK